MQQRKNTATDKMIFLFSSMARKATIKAVKRMKSGDAIVYCVNNADSTNIIAKVQIISCSGSNTDSNLRKFQNRIMAQTKTKKWETHNLYPNNFHNNAVIKPINGGWYPVADIPSIGL